MLVTLDPVTIELLAEFICGDEDSAGPVYRKGWELPLFFRNCGLECINHDGATRKHWTIDRLKEYNETFAMEKVLQRLADPHEYQRLENSHQALRNAILYLNEKLAVDKLRFTNQGGTFKLQQIDPTGSYNPFYPESLEKEPSPSFEKKSFPPALSVILTSRWEDAQKCWEVGAYALSIISMGSLLEGVLLQVVNNNPQEANSSPYIPKNSQTGKPKQFYELTLLQLLDIAFSCQWLRKDRLDFSQTLRDYRNIVHPWHQMHTEKDPDSGTCAICWEVVKAAVRDLLNYC